MKLTLIPALMVMMLIPVANGQFGEQQKLPPVNLHAPDLVAGVPHLTEDRRIAFTVINRSNIGESKTFQAVLYVNGAVKQTFDINGARAYSTHLLSTVDSLVNCGPLSLRVVVDPDNRVAEADEQNNTKTNDLPSACPDVTASISKKWVNNNLQYKAHIEVVNNGGVIMPKVSVRTLGAPWWPNDTAQPATNCLSNPQISGSCVKNVTIVGPLAPGEKFGYEPGGKYDLGQNLSVQVDITCGTPGQPRPPECVESDYNNNTVRKGL
jgi:CARDB